MYNPAPGNASQHDRDISWAHKDKQLCLSDLLSPFVFFFSFLKEEIITLRRRKTPAHLLSQRVICEHNMHSSQGANSYQEQTNKDIFGYLACRLAIDTVAVINQTSPERERERGTLSLP